jgi:hypothetical protein
MQSFSRTYPIPPGLSTKPLCELEKRFENDNP